LGENKTKGNNRGGHCKERKLNKKENRSLKGKIVKLGKCKGKKGAYWCTGIAGGRKI
jgi:hypothetical protein